MYKELLNQYEIPYVSIKRDLKSATTPITRLVTITVKSLDLKHDYLTNLNKFVKHVTRLYSEDMHNAVKRSRKCDEEESTEGSSQSKIFLGL